MPIWDTTSVLQVFPLPAIEAAKILCVFYSGWPQATCWCAYVRGSTELPEWELGKKTNLCQESGWPIYSILFARRPAMLGLMGLFWQPDLVRDSIIDTIVMLIWANNDACLLGGWSLQLPSRPTEDASCYLLFIQRLKTTQILRNGTCTWLNTDHDVITTSAMKLFRLLFFVIIASLIHLSVNAADPSNI